MQRSDDSFAYTTQGEFVQIVDFLLHENNFQYTIVKKINTQEMNILCRNIKKIVSIDEDLQIIDTSTIDKPCVHLTFEENEFISTIAHTHVYS